MPCGGTAQSLLARASLVEVPTGFVAAQLERFPLKAGSWTPGQISLPLMLPEVRAVGHSLTQVARLRVHPDLHGGRLRARSRHPLGLRPSGAKVSDFVAGSERIAPALN